ncbi:MAG: PQ-loop domain-containing transporter [Flavobacterium sp.]
MQRLKSTHSLSIVSICLKNSAHSASLVFLVVKSYSFQIFQAFSACKTNIS